RTQYAQPMIVGFNSLNGVTTDPMFTWVDGWKENSGWSYIKEFIPGGEQFFAPFAIASDFDGTSPFEFWKGKINEMIVYSRQLTDPEMQQVNTYLAIKWSATLGQGNGFVGNNGNNYNYVASDASVIWNATTNTTYKYDIAGVGRDDASGLNQKQSASVNLGNILTIGNGAI